jgi:hypothetical protein
MALLIGSGIVIIILLVLLFTRGTPPPIPPPPAPKAAVPAPQTPAAVPQTPKPAPAAAANLTEQLRDVLASLRDAQLHKNIIQFMNAFSLTYPELDSKRANTLRAWENYDFTNLVFKLDKVQLLDPDNATAWVTWYIDVRSRRTQELSSYNQTYQVRFAKELGKWRIRSLEEVEQ